MPEDARDLIEGVYGEDSSDAVPPSLQDASLRAEAEQKAQSGMGEFNRLKLESGYTRSSAGQSGGWDEDVNIPTRLSSDSVVVALARLENGVLAPYADNVEDAWALSQINLPKAEWTRAEKLIPSALTTLIETLKDQNNAIKRLKLLPLCSETKHLYHPSEGWRHTDSPALAGNK